jgi:1-acyl-sn-glycerol-3-phosphate acyltransferase
MPLEREASFMARDTLFVNPPFKRLIESLNAFPVRRGTADLGAIKEALRRLKKGGLLILFPEGTRSEDGRIKPLLPGLGAIAKKSRVPLVPTLIDGMVQAWPRGYTLPAPGDVIVEYDTPVPPAEYADLSVEALMNLLHDRLTDMQHRLHSRVPQRRLEWFEHEILT